MMRDDLRERLQSVGTRLEAVEAAFASLDPPAPAIRYLWSGCETAALTALAADKEGSLSERWQRSRPRWCSPRPGAA